MLETDSLFEDDLLYEQDLRDDGERASLPGTLIGGLAEAERSLGVEGLGANARAARGFFAVLRTLDSGRKQQKIYHLGQLSEVARAVEATRTADIYLGNATYASARSRRATNVRALQVAWVDVDCYNLALAPTPDLVEKLVERARFAGVPAPTHIVCSGRGLYLKWLLEAPVSDTDLKPWGMLQAGLSALYRDVGADFTAIDSARVLRVVGSRNSKVDATAPSARLADPSMVGVVWDSGKRHRFEDLAVAVAQLDLCIAAPPRSRAKSSHQAQFAAMQDLPPELRGNLKLLEMFGRDRNPNLDLEAKARSEGKSGMSGVTLGWHRFLDLRDLFQQRAEARGSTGIEEGSRDLSMLWMVNFLAQARMVRSANVFREVEMLLPAFAGVGAPGPRGFESPAATGALDTLVAKMKASEAGKRVRFGGGLWDPKYTPSNDYLINLFGITSEEMKGLRTIIDSGEKRERADRKVPGRAERREERRTWQASALELRASLSKPDPQTGAPKVPARKLNAHIAQALGVHPERLRKFLQTHDAAAALKEARKRGEAPPRMRRKPPKPLAPSGQVVDLHPLTPAPQVSDSPSMQAFRRRGYDGPEDPHAIQAWLRSLRDVSEGNEPLPTEHENKEAKSREVFEGVLARIALRMAAAKAAPASGPASPDTEESGSGDLATKNEFLRERIFTRENVRTQGTHMPSTSQIHDEPATVADRPKVSKRELLNRARKALKKEPLASSVSTSVDGNGMQDGLFAEAPAPQPEPLATSEEPVAAPLVIATNVIPADLSGAWPSGLGHPPGEVLSDQGEPAGMPDFGDAYLDSQVSEGAFDGDRPNDQPDMQDMRVAQDSNVRASLPYRAPPSSPRLAAGAASPAAALARPASFQAPARGKVLSFARPAARSPAVATPSFARPAPARAPSSTPAAAPGAASVTPTQVIGFGVRPATLSHEQARLNGQGDDFAKMFGDPSYDARGIPVGYPKPAVWPEDDLPAGSNYDRDEWAAARVAEPDMPQGHIVVEIQVGNPIRSALLQIPRMAPREPDPEGGGAGGLRVVEGKVVRVAPTVGVEDLVADALADTIIVSRKSAVDPRWRGAAEGGIEQMRGGVSSYFRIIRPRAHFTDPEKALFINAKLQLRGSFGEAGARMSDAPPGQVDAEPAADEAEGESPRG